MLSSPVTLCFLIKKILFDWKVLLLPLFGIKKSQQCLNQFYQLVIFGAWVLKNRWLKEEINILLSQRKKISWDAKKKFDTIFGLKLILYSSKKKSERKKYSCTSLLFECKCIYLSWDETRSDFKVCVSYAFAIWYSSLCGRVYFVWLKIIFFWYCYRVFRLPRKRLKLKYLKVGLNKLK